MMIGNVLGLLVRPKTQWQRIADKGESSLAFAIAYIAILALLPALAWYYGTTKIGWTVGDGDVVKMTHDSSAVIIGLFYATMVVSVCVIGYTIRWMSKTYGSDATLSNGVAVAGFSATPLFIAGAIGFFPVFWVALLISVVAVSYAVYLLFLGIPIMMKIPQERGFLFASAVIAFCLVILMIIMGGTVILWDMGAAPSFTD